MTLITRIKKSGRKALSHIIFQLSVFIYVIRGLIFFGCGYDTPGALELSGSKNILQRIELNLAIATGMWAPTLLKNLVCVFCASVV